MRTPQGELCCQFERLLAMQNLRIGSDTRLAQMAQAARDAHVSDH
jgi:hypothetical protein